MSNPLFSKLRLEELEQRLVLSISGSGTPNLTPPQTAYENLVVANVVGENIFYNDSTFDGNDPTANAADDAAIATDKTALLPGQTATFANYTSYSRGINGIMVDIAGLPGNVTASDFVFMVGNSNDATTWTQLTVAPTVTIRWGAGAQGSDRVELTWANNTIQNEWLQVTVLADADTGLSANTVFYYGNAIGETGNSTTDAQVTTADETATQSHETSQAGITNVYDFNRDGQVSSADVSIVAANLTTAATALNLITAPAAAATTPFAAEQPDFMHADGQYSIFFAPQIIETNDGTLISVAEARVSDHDAQVAGFGETISTDGGQTWSPITIMYSVPEFPGNVVSIGSLVVDHTTGTVFFLFSVNDNTPMLMSSSDDGHTWSTPQNITSEVMNPSWQWMDFGPGNGIQLTIGPNAGRLVVEFDYRYQDTSSVPSYDGVVYSDNDGATWQFGGGPDPSNPANLGVNEAAIVQLSSGAIYMNSRLNSGTNTAPARGYSISTDGGITWSNVQYDYSLPVASVEGSIIRLDPNTLVFAAPDDPDNSGVRQQMTLWASFDDGQTWVKERVINYEFASYSDMVALGDDSAMLVFNVGQAPNNNGAVTKDELVKFNLASLLDGQSQPVQFTYTFNEQPIGQPAPIGGSSIRDDGPWDQRGTVQSTLGASYYVAGSNGNEALRIVNGSNVDLSPATTDGMQLGSNSFTFEFVLRTTQANGVLLGEEPDEAGYNFSMVGGAITLSVDSGFYTETLTGPTIDDGAWHDVVGIRNTQTHTLSLYVDGQLVATTADTTGKVQNSDDVTLGSYADGTDQLTFDIQLLQVTQAALTPSQFLTANYVAPPTLPAPTSLASNVLNLPGLAFYLPPYDDRHYFADSAESDPLLILPTPGTEVQSAIDATGHYDAQGYSNSMVEYETAPNIGSYMSSQSGVGWNVVSANGTQSADPNFNFVQNTETFTISDVFNVPSIPSSGSLTLVGNNSGTSSEPGFDLTVDSSGNLDFDITDGIGTGTSLVNQALATYSGDNNSLPQLSTGGWYQIVIVGNGPGTPLQYYLTPMTAAAVQQYQTSTAMTPIATPTGVGLTPNLQIANVGDSVGTDSPTVNFKDLAIFNQALTPGQVQQLFAYAGTLPVVTASGTSGNYTVGGPALAVDPGVTVASDDSELTAATVTISSGTLQSGDRLNFTNQNGISGSYSGGVLTLSGAATAAQYQAALQSVTFSSTTTITSITTRSISIVAVDNTLVSNPAAESLTVGDDFVTPSGSVAKFTISGPAVQVDSGVTVSSSDTHLSGATVTISSGTLKAGDTLSFTSPVGSGISGVYSGGVLTLSGSATVAQYQAALQSLKFSTTSGSTGTRSISIVTIDNTIDSNVAPESVIVSTPVTITALYVNGSSWSKFDAYLGSNGYGSATLGYALLTGSSQLTPLPWSTINQIDVQFSGPIKGGAIAASSIELVGGTGGAGRAAAAPTVTSVTSLGGNAYQINLSGSLGYNDYILAIASTGSSFGPAITDTNGVAISGAFTTGQSFPSGNGVAGSTFDFAFDVLPGDGNQNGSVNAQDSARVGQLLNDKTTGATAANYSPFYDYNANGTTNTQDSSIVSQGLNLKMSNIIPPLAPSAQLVVEPAVVGPVVVIPSATGLTALELGVQESGQAGGSSTSTAGNVNSTGATLRATAGTSSTGTAAAESGSTGTGNSTTWHRGHGRHALAATDEAVADFDLAELFA